MSTTALFSVDVDHTALFDWSMVDAVDVHFTALFITPKNRTVLRCIKFSSFNVDTLKLLSYKMVQAKTSIRKDLCSFNKLIYGSYLRFKENNFFFVN